MNSDENLLDYGFEKTDPSLEEQQQIARYKRQFHDNESHVNKGKGALAFLIVVEIIGLVISLNSMTDTSGTIGVVVILLVYAGLLVWSFYRPYPALLTSLILYLFLILLAFIASPLSAIKGLVIKGIIIYFLVQGFQHAKKNREIKTFLEKFGERVTVNYSRDRRVS